MPRAQLYCAIDRGDVSEARAIAAAVGPAVDGIKLGLEFFLANGPAGVRLLKRGGQPIFLDLKLLDIPNTVAGAVRAAGRVQPRFLTLHAGGGKAMMRAAVDAVADGGVPMQLLAVTVLTSLDASDLHGLGVHRQPADQVRALAELALEVGCGGLVCAAAEVALLRETFGPQPILVVPGIRPADAPAEDQKRTLTPREAQDAGADVLVVGRPITAAERPGDAAAAIRADLAVAAP
jgi:orotidine-5'-phosphate decarboxylase